MNNKDLLYKKLTALRLEVHSSIVDDIITTVDDLFGQPNGSKPDVSGRSELLLAFAEWIAKDTITGLLGTPEYYVERFLKANNSH